MAIESKTKIKKAKIMAVIINTDQLTEEIISIVSENCLSEELTKAEIEILLNSTNGQFVKSVFESYLQGQWECDISTLYKLVDRLDSFPCELIPTSLFSAAMKVALNQVNWNTVAGHKDIRPKIKELKATNTPRKTTEESVLTEIRVVNIIDSDVVDTNPPNYQTNVFYCPPTWFHTITGETFLFSQLVHVKWNIEDLSTSRKSFDSLVYLSNGSNVKLVNEDRQKLLDVLRINIKLSISDSFITLPSK
jgi:hypothetical protein